MSDASDQPQVTTDVDPSDVSPDVAVDSPVDNARPAYAYSREQVIALNPIRAEQGLDPLPEPEHDGLELYGDELLSYAERCKRTGQ